MASNPYERWPGYNEQSWAERFAQLDRRWHQERDLKLQHVVALAAKDAEIARLTRLIEDAADCPEGFKPLGLLPVDTHARIAELEAQLAEQKRKESWKIVALQVQLSEQREKIAEWLRNNIAQAIENMEWDND